MIFHDIPILVSCPFEISMFSASVGVPKRLKIMFSLGYQRTLWHLASIWPPMLQMPKQNQKAFSNPAFQAAKSLLIAVVGKTHGTSSGDVPAHV